MWTSFGDFTNCLRRVVPAAVLAAAVAAGGCRMAPTERNELGDPDARLAEALRDLDNARRMGLNNNTVPSGESVIMDPETATLRFDHLAIEFPQHIPTLAMCAMLSFEAANYEKAAGYADRVLALQPEHNFAAIIRARVALQEDNIPRAQVVLERQIRMTPESPYLHELMAAVHYFSGDLAAADLELRQAERHGSEAARIAYLRGLLAEKRGGADEARKQFARALELEPGFEQAQSHLLGLTRPAPAN